MKVAIEERSISVVGSGDQQESEEKIEGTRMHVLRYGISTFSIEIPVAMWVSSLHVSQSNRLISIPGF